MKKITGILAALLIFVSSLAFAGGDKVCGDKGAGPTGTDGGGETTQNRLPNPD